MHVELASDVEVTPDGRVLVTSREASSLRAPRRWEVAGCTLRDRLEMVGTWLFAGAMRFEDGCRCDASEVRDELARDMGTFEDWAYPGGEATTDAADVWEAQAGFCATFALLVSVRCGMLDEYRSAVPAGAS